MRTKFFLLLTAMMLLVGTNVRAQITEAEIQKADVNGDFDVNVADIVGAIDIMDNLGKPDGVYKYYLGIISVEQLFDDENHIVDENYIVSLINNSTTTYTGKPSTITIPNSGSKNDWVIWIFDSKMGTPHFNLFDPDKLSSERPELSGYTIFFWPKSYYDARSLGFEWNSSSGLTYQDGDVNSDGLVDESDIKAVINTMKKIENMGGLKKNFYLGLTNIRKTVWTESDFNGYSATPLTEFRTPAVTNDNPFIILIHPASWGTIENTTVDGERRNPWIYNTPWITSLPSNYKAAITRADDTQYFTDIEWTE